jgi:hypothetical protein
VEGERNRVLACIFHTSCEIRTRRAAHPLDVLGYPAPSSDHRAKTKLVLRISGNFRRNMFASKVLLGCQPSGHELSGFAVGGGAIADEIRNSKSEIRSIGRAKRAFGDEVLTG